MESPLVRAPSAIDGIGVTWHVLATLIRIWCDRDLFWLPDSDDLLLELIQNLFRKVCELQLA